MHPIRARGISAGSSTEARRKRSRALTIVREGKVGTIPTTILDATGNIMTAPDLSSQ